MVRRIIVLLAASMISITLQAVVIVKGQVVDAITGAGEPYATFQILEGGESGNSVLMTITDENGIFEASLSEKGSYTLRISALGRKTIIRDFLIDNSDALLDFGRLPIEDDVENLASSTVTALRPLVKMDVDKMTYRVEDDVDSRSSTVLDMLRKVPMVTVDGQDRIMVNGSSSFKVLVNGKPNVMMSSNPSEVFRSMPASSVKNIEVITNPGVKYDAEGVGGVLNIITNATPGAGGPEMDGYNATLRAMATTRGGGVGGYLSAQKGSFTVNANVNTMYNRIKGTEGTMTREQIAPFSGSVLSSVSQTSTQVMDVPITMGSISLGYEIDSLRLMSASFGVNKIAANTVSELTTNIESPLGRYAYSSSNESAWNLNSITGSFDYQRGFASKKDRFLTFSYQFSSAPTNTDTKTLIDAGATYHAPSRKTDGDINTVENTFQVDYSTPLRPGHTLNIGAKYIYRVNRSDQVYYTGSDQNWIYDEQGSLKYRHKNHILAGYGEYGIQKERYGISAGLRYEHTLQNVNYLLGSGENFRLDYGNLVPAVSLQYNLSQTGNIGLSYNMRISRPGITYLNPYRDTSDPTAVSYGNTDLKTELAHNVNLVYNYYSPKVMLNLTARYTHIGNAIGQYSFYTSDGLLNTTYGNIISNDSAGLNAFVNWNIGSKTRLSTNGNVSHVNLRSEELKETNHGWTADAYVGFQQTLPWDIRFSANLMYASRSLSLEGWADGTTMLMGGFTKSFLDDNLTIGISGITGFDKRGNLTRTNYSEGRDYRNASTSSVPMAQVIFNVSWSFGRNNRKVAAKSSRHTIINDDLKNLSNTAEEMGSMINLQ